MEHVLVLIAVSAVFVPALLLPGPDFVAVVRSAMAHGTRSGLLTTLGVSLGLCFYATLSLVGLSALLVEYQWLTWRVRVLGGGYLIYLGARLLWTRPAPLDIADTGPPSRSRAVLVGFVVTLTNPKAIVLFAGVFATAITATTPVWLMALTTGLVGVSSLVWYSLVSFCMASPLPGSPALPANQAVDRASGRRLLRCLWRQGPRRRAQSPNPMIIAR